MQLLLASSSTIFGSKPLEYLEAELTHLYRNCNDVLFIPYARPGGITHENYTAHFKPFFNKIGKNLVGINELSNPIEAIKNAQGFFTGGGNTFVLLYQLYKNKLISPIQDAVKSGTPYLGTSAGSNICGLTINTTNDMPIVYPPSFKALGLVPFNINPHYMDSVPNSKHMGETRETRIKEFHAFNRQPVIGLREGSWLDIDKERCILKGNLTTRVFQYQQEAFEVEPFANLSHIK